MPDGEVENSRADDEFEVTDLRPRSTRPPARGSARRRVALGVSLALLLVAFVGALPATRDALGQLRERFATPTAVVISEIHVSEATIVVPSGPTPTAVPGVSGVPALGRAPRGCGDNPAAPLREADPPGLGNAVGVAPIWVGGFEGPYPTLRFKTEGDPAPYGWPLHYTQYGWPVPIDLMLGPGAQGPVTLTGWNPEDLHPLWFGFVSLPAPDPPAQITTSFTLDPLHPSVPEGGASSESGFWYGYAFVPKAGCYALTATWPGGAWKVLISAGR